MEFESKLIELVKAAPCLYENTANTSKGVQHRLLQWKNISYALGRPVLECKQRWRSLRDRFVREKRQMPSKRIKPTAKNAEKCEFHNQMAFLDSLVKTRKKRVKKKTTKKTYRVENPGNAFSLEESLPVFKMAAANQIKKCFSDEEYEIACDEEPGDETSYLSETSVNNFKGFDGDGAFCSKSLPKTNQNRQVFESFEAAPPVSTTADPLHRSNSGFSDVLREKRPLSPDRDENDLFLDCIAMKMKRLSVPAKLRLQIKILDIVSEELLKELATNKSRN